MRSSTKLNGFTTAETSLRRIVLLLPVVMIFSPCSSCCFSSCCSVRPVRVEPSRWKRSGLAIEAYLLSVASELFLRRRFLCLFRPINFNKISPFCGFSCGEGNKKAANNGSWWQWQVNPLKRRTGRRAKHTGAGFVFISEEKLLFSTCTLRFAVHILTSFIYWNLQRIQQICNVHNRKFL